MPKLIKNNIAILRYCKISVKRIICVYLLSFIISILEASGIGMFLPIGEYLLYAEEKKALNTASWQLIYKTFAYIGLEPSIIYVISITILLILMRQILTYLKLILSAKIQYEIAKTLRKEFFSSILELDLKHSRSFKTGENTNLATNEIHQTAISGISPFDIVTGAFLLTAYFIIMAFLSLKATLSIILIGIVLGVFIKKLNKILDVLSKRHINFNNIFTQHFVERLRAIKLIKLNSLHNKEYLTNKNILDKQYRINIDFTKVQGITSTAFEPLVLGMLLPALVIAVQLGVNLSIIGMYAIILARFVPTFKAIIGGIQSFIRYNASCEKVLNSLKTFSNMKEVRNGVESFPIKFKKISFKRVNFRYKGSKNFILRNFSCTFKANEVNAIIGSSGIGKTTLIDLLSLLIEPSSGKIFIDKLDIKLINIKSLRENLAYVDQKPFFFKGSIMENLCYSQKKYNKSLSIKAAKMAKAHYFINKLPKKYNYMLGETGVGLSGGQLQRLEIAKALATGRKIIILDEPTSNLDSKKSKEILETHSSK